MKAPGTTRFAAMSLN